jgi:hypothetical protein
MDQARGTSLRRREHAQDLAKRLRNLLDLIAPQRHTARQIKAAARDALGHGA